MAKANKLFDNFDDNLLDATKWSTFTNGAGASVAETGGKIVCTVPTSLISEAQLFSTKIFDITNSYFQFKVTKSAGTTVDTACKVYVTDSNNALWFLIGSNLNAVKTIASAETTITSIAYDSTAMAYLRFRELNGTFYWDYGSDGNSWTNLTSLAIPFAVDRVQFMFDVNEWASDAAATNGTLDNLNIPAPNYPENAFRSVSVGNGMSRNEGAT